ncbi:MAG TPA: flagellar FliJ family protein [Candidatus Hydrogenedentes bacterium]|nr:flagellar FliJ family protein [Candidatus Hydrogenedentota bacterium]
MASLKPFRYGVLLRVRQRQEDLKSLALAEMRRAVHTAEEQHSEIVGEQIAALTAAAALTRERFDASDVRCYFSYERYLSRLAVEKHAELMHLRTQEEVRRGELEQAMKNRKILERLKEHRDAAYQYELGREEQHYLDEVAVNRAAMANGRRAS